MNSGSDWIKRRLGRALRGRLSLSGRACGPGIGLLQVVGRLDQQGLPVFWSHAARRLQWGEASLLIDLRRCTEFTASAAVACMVLSLECRRGGGDAVLITADGFPPDVFDRIGATRAVRSADDLAGALGLLRRPVSPRSEPA